MATTLSRSDRLDRLPFTKLHRKILWVSGIGWAMDHRAEVLNRIRTGQAYVEQTFSPEVVGGLWLAALRDILGSRVSASHH